KARVYDLAGRMVKRLFDGAVPAGSRTWIWDLRDESGRRVPPGVFVAEIRGYGSIVRRRIAVLRSGQGGDAMAAPAAIAVSAHIAGRSSSRGWQRRGH